MPHNAADPMEQLAASLVDDITIGLCRLRTLSVVAPYTSKRVVAESTIDNFPGLNEQFGVNYAVDSKIVRRDGFCFLSVKLVDVATQEIVWAEKQKFDYVLPEQQYRQLSIRIILSVVSVIEKSELDRYNKLFQDPNAYYWYLDRQEGYRQVRSCEIAPGAAVFQECADRFAGFRAGAQRYRTNDAEENGLCEREARRISCLKASRLPSGPRQPTRMTSGPCANSAPSACILANLTTVSNISTRASRSIHNMLIFWPTMLMP